MSAPGLRELQAGFWRSLRAGEADPGLAAVVLPTGALAAPARIGIYQDMYFWRLHEVLREDFPKTQEALGDAFADLARRYLACHPSEHPSVRHLGERLSGFLVADPVAALRPWLPDLARLERARVDAFDAPDATPVRTADLAAVAPEAWAELRFAPIPALEWLRCDWPAHEVWAAPDASPEPRPTRLRVWRQDFVVLHAAIDPVEEAAFAALAAGASFAAICEVVAEHVPEDAAAAEAGSLLARWIADGLVAGFSAG